MTTRATIRTARIHLGFAFYVLIASYVAINVCLAAFVWWADFQTDMPWGWKLLWPSISIAVLFPGVLWLAYTLFDEALLPELAKVQKMADEVQAAEIQEKRRIAEQAQRALEPKTYRAKLPRGMLDANPDMDVEDYDHEH